MVHVARVKPTRDLRRELDAAHLRFGDWSDQRWGWELTNLHRLSEPVRIRGAQGLWDIDPGILNDPAVQEVA